VAALVVPSSCTQTTSSAGEPVPSGARNGRTAGRRESIRRSGDRPLCREPGANAARGPDLPLDALHQDLRVAELERMHDRHHLMAAHLLRPPRSCNAVMVRTSSGSVCPRAPTEVAIEPLQLRGDSLLGARRRAATRSALCSRRSPSNSWSISAVGARNGNGIELAGIGRRDALRRQLRELRVTCSSARAPVARSMTALSDHGFLDHAPARSTIRASSRPTVCVASWICGAGRSHCEWGL